MDILQINLPLETIKLPLTLLSSLLLLCLLLSGVSVSELYGWSLTSGEGLREHLGGERGLGARARGGAVLVLQVMLVRVVLLLAQHVPPAPVQEAVQDVRGDDVREGQRRLEARLQAQRGAGQHGAHGGESRGESRGQSRGQGEILPLNKLKKTKKHSQKLLFYTDRGARRRQEQRSSLRVSVRGEVKILRGAGAKRARAVWGGLYMELHHLLLL